MQWFAAAQEEIGRRLAEAPAAPPPSGPDAETAAAAHRQAEVKGKTAGLQHELESLAEDLGAAPPEAAGKLEAAQGEQGSAEGDLGRGDSGGALTHQEKALELLEQGGQDLQRSAAAQKQIEIGINAGFSQPASGVRSMSGAGVWARASSCAFAQGQGLSAAQGVARGTGALLAREAARLLRRGHQGVFQAHLAVSLITKYRRTGGDIVKTATFSELRNQARKYFDAVERGETIEIYRHGKPVAILMPVPKHSRERWRTAQPLRLSGASLSEAILADRR